MSEPESISSILSADGSLAILGLGRRWAELFGSWMAQRCRPAAFRKGLLVVTADSSVLAQELHLQGEAIREKLNQALGKEMIQEIRFKVGSAPRPKTPPTPPEPSPPTTPSRPEAGLVPDLSAIADAELKETVLRVRLKSAQRRGDSSPVTIPGKKGRG